ncbi:MAG TPA: hypothetical protein VHD38_02750 [Candidatus Paceibacterota bacterium]|nr:hypothetical protein [Candidatus Paceibacterota bacterium]
MMCLRTSDFRSSMEREAFMGDLGKAELMFIGVVCATVIAPIIYLMGRI